MKEWVKLAASEGVPTDQLVVKRAGLARLSGARSEMQRVWVLSEYHDARAPEGSWGMTPGSPEILGLAVGLDARLYAFRGRSSKGSRMEAVRTRDGALVVPVTPPYDNQILALMFESVIDGWWTLPILLEGVQREGKQDRFCFK